MKENTYTAYERGPDTSKHTALDHSRAVQFGRKFKVSWVWILSGEGTPFDRSLSPLQVRAVSALESASPEMQEAAVESIERLVKAAG